MIYIDDRLYVVNGVLESMGTVASGISPDDSIFYPLCDRCEISGRIIGQPDDHGAGGRCNNVEGVIEEVTEVLATSYPER